MSRTVAVEYLVPVIVYVDIDCPEDEIEDGGVTEVHVADETIMRLDSRKEIEKYIARDVLQPSYDTFSDHYVRRPSRLSAKNRERALRIAEEAMWPAWEHGW